jgi:putative copper resistance protein D
VRLSWDAVKDLPVVHAWLAGGAAYVAAGLGLLAWSARRVFRPRWAAGFGALGVLWGGAAGLSALAIDAYPTTYLRPAVPYHALSVAHGAKLYATHCAVCHGAEGRGDGPAAAGLDRPPADLTAKHASDHTAGDLFWWVTHGIPGTPMPGFGHRLSEEERWDLINYLRALAAAERVRALGPALAPPEVAAPDFAFSPGVGRTETLRDHRGVSVVHLVLFTLPGSLSRLEALDQAWSRLGAAGARVLAVPLTAPEQVYRRLGLRVLNLLLAVEGSEEIAATYLLFARDRGADPPPHVEFLIDRQGYLRARWRPDRDPGWTDVGRLVDAVARLDRERPTAPPPEEHVH